MCQLRKLLHSEKYSDSGNRDMLIGSEVCI